MASNKEVFYTPKEIVEKKLLPFQSVQTIRRMVAKGQIAASRNEGHRTFMFIPAREVKRISKKYMAIIVRKQKARARRLKAKEQKEK